MRRRKSDFFFISMCLFLSACTAAESALNTPYSPTAEVTTQTIETSLPTESLQTATDMMGLEPGLPSLVLMTGIPQGLWQVERLPEGMVLGNNPNGEELILGLRSGADADMTIISEADWIYALAAPFYTIQDDVETDDLVAFWNGSRQGSMADVSQLVVRVGDYLSLCGFLGQASSETVRVEPQSFINDSLWGSEDLWLILPFDELIPQWKVISINGNSPLHKDFTISDYPLVGEYALYGAKDTIESLDEGFKAALTAGIVPTNRDSEKMTTLVMTGVTALVRGTAYRMEINGVTYPAEDIVEWLAGADITHISNEVSFYRDCPFPDPKQGMLFFCSSPDYIKLFDYVGADVIELTGNHNNDTEQVYGVDVVPSSINLYLQRGMVYYGGGLDLQDAMRPAVIEHNGNKFAFVGCNPNGPDYAWATDDHGGSAPCGDFTWMADELSRLRGNGYIPIATFQYYENYANFASEQQREDFRMMADAGAVIVNGSQAHRPKEMEFYGGAFIHYGLGNLFFDQMGVLVNDDLVLQTRWEFIQRHVFYDGKHISTELLTAMLEDYAKPRPMTERERQAFLEEIFAASGWR